MVGFFVGFAIDRREQTAWIEYITDDPGGNSYHAARPPRLLSKSNFPCLTRMTKALIVRPPAAGRQHSGDYQIRRTAVSSDLPICERLRPAIGCSRPLHATHNFDFTEVFSDGSRRQMPAVSAPARPLSVSIGPPDGHRLLSGNSAVLGLGIREVLLPTRGPRQRTGPRHLIRTRLSPPPLPSHKINPISHPAEDHPICPPLPPPKSTPPVRPSTPRSASRPLALQPRYRHSLLARQGQVLQVQPAQRRQGFDDLKLFGFFEDDWLRGVPVRRWVPRGLRQAGLCLRDRRHDRRSEMARCPGRSLDRLRDVFRHAAGEVSSPRARTG